MFSSGVEPNALLSCSQTVGLLMTKNTDPWDGPEEPGSEQKVDPAGARAASQPFSSAAVSFHSTGSGRAFILGMRQVLAAQLWHHGSL